MTGQSIAWLSMAHGRLFRLIISQEEPSLDGQYITVTRFKTGHEISLPARYVKRECDTKNVENGAVEEEEGEGGLGGAG